MIRADFEYHCEELEVVKLQPNLAGAIEAAESEQVDSDRESRRAAAMCVGQTLQYCERVAAIYDVTSAIGKEHGPKYRRYVCKDWWKRKLERRNAQRIEHKRREEGQVCKMRSPYLSDETLQAIQAKRTAAARVLHNLIALNRETGEVLNLGEAAEHGLSNPEVRVAELLARSRGMEEHADQQGLRAEMWTLTTPSRFHAVNEKGKPNKKHDGETPRDARDHLQKVWSRVRAALAYRGIEFFALRVAEPHHDGTPHWHIMMYLPRAKAAEAYAIFAKRGLAESPTERGAKKYRVDRKIMRKGQSATGYMLKYIVKNITGFRIEFTTEGVEGKEGAARSGAWASIWGIRQFQFSGLVAIGPYRELRRIADADAVPAGLLNLHTAAREGQYSDFLGDARVWAIELLKGAPTEGKYGDLVPTVRGVALGFTHLITRPDVWEILPVWSVGKPLNPTIQPPTQNPNLITEARRDAARARGPWTRLNNCRGISPHAKSQPINAAQGPP